MAYNKAPAGVPFSTSFVMSVTLEHMNKSLEISIDKSLKRLPEFEGEPKKGIEIMETISALQALQGMLKEFEKYNPKLFTN